MADLQFPAFDEVEVGGSDGIGDNAFPAFDDVEIPAFDSVDAGGMVEPKQRKPRLGIRDTLKARSQAQEGVEPESTAHAIVGNFPVNKAMRSADQKALVDIYEGRLPDYKGHDFGAEGGGMGDWLTPPKETSRIKGLDDAGRLAELVQRRGDFAKESVRMWRQMEEPKLKPEEREESLKGWLQKDAERELKDRIQAKRAAGKTLDEHERSIWNKMVVGAAENVGYQAAFTVNHGVALGTAFADRQARLSTSEYELDDNGRLYLNKAGDTEGTAAMKALVGAGVETGVEMLLGKAIGAVGGKVAKGILKGVARKAPVTANLIGKAIKKYVQLAKVTKLEDPVGETGEEWVQNVADAGIGLDLKQSEMEGKPLSVRVAEARAQFSPTEVMLSMAFLMGGQTAMSTASATMDHATLNRNLDNSLKLFGGLEDADLKGVSTKDKILMARRVAGTMTPEKVEVLTRHLDAKAQQALKKAYDRQQFYQQAQAEGVEPTFTLGGDGKSPYVDTKSGIGIIPEDGKYRVVNRDGADVGVFNSAGEAIAEAKKQSQVNVVLDQQRQKKADYARLEAERLAGGMPVRIFNTEAEMLQEIPEIGESPDYQEGITGVQHKGGMVLVLDNLTTPAEVVRTIMHEGGAHEGIRRVLGDKAGLNQFLGNLGGQQFEVGKRRLKLGGQEFADQLTEADEALATVYENRLADPTAYQKSVSWLHNQLRRINPNVKYTESDVEVMMADAQQKVLRAEGGFDGAYVGPETGRGAREAVEQAQYDQDMLRREESFPKRQEQSQDQDIEPRNERPAQAVNADKAEAEKVNERYAQENPQAYREAMQAARGDVAQANRIYEEITAEVPEDSTETPSTPTAPTSPPQAPVADAQAANEPGATMAAETRPAGQPEAAKVRGAGVSVEDAYKSGMDVKTIAKTFGVDYTAVAKQLEKAGLISVSRPAAKDEAPEPAVKSKPLRMAGTVHGVASGQEAVGSGQGTVTTKPPELMTPEEFNKTKEKVGRVSTDAEHAWAIRDALQDRLPVNRKAYDEYSNSRLSNGIGELPIGYVREGDRYVFRGEDATPPAPPAPQEPARPASSPDVNDLKREFFKDRGLTLLKLASMKKSQKQKIDAEWKAWYKEQTAKQGATTPAEATQAPVEAAPGPTPANDAPKAEKGKEGAKAWTTPVAYRVPPGEIRRMRYRDLKAVAQANKYPSGVSAWDTASRTNADGLRQALLEHRRAYMEAEGKKDRAPVSNETRAKLRRAARSRMSAKQDADMLDHYAFAQLQDIMRSEPQVVPEDELFDGDMVWRDNQWYKVKKTSDGGTVLEDGVRIEYERYDPVEIQGVVRKDDPAYPTAKKEHTEQEQALEGKERPTVKPVVAAAEGADSFEFGDEEQVPDALSLESVTQEQLDAEAARKRQQEEITGRADRKITGDAGDLTADLFGEQEGETPLFNARRDGQSTVKDSLKVETPSAKAPKESKQTTEIIPNSREIKITNLDQLPRGLGARYLEVVRGENGVLVAKQWRRKELDGAILVDMEAKPDAAPSRFPRGAMASTAYNKDGIAYTGRIVSENADKGTVTIRATKERQKGRNVVARNYGVDKQGNQIVKDVEVAADLVRVIDAVDSGAKRTPVEQAAIEELDREANARLKEVVGEQTPEVTDEIDAVAKRDDSEDADPDEAYEGTRFRRAVTPDVEREFASLTSTLKLPKGTRAERQAALDEWIKGNPKEYAALEKLRGDVLKAAGYNVGPVWHGTNRKFTIFDKTRINSNENPENPLTGGKGMYGEGFYFAPVKDEGATYGKRVMAAYLSAQKPLDLSDNKALDGDDLRDKFKKIVSPGYKEYVEARGSDLDRVWTARMLTWRDAQSPFGEEYARRSMVRDLLPLGFDSVFVGGAKEKQSGSEIVVFSPSQIKSADPLALDDSGELITPRRWAEEDTADIRFRRPAVTPEQDAAFDDFLEMYSEAHDEAIGDFVREFRSSANGQVASWPVVPAGRLKKIWTDHARMGFVRDEAGMDGIARKMIGLVARLEAATEILGHTQIDAREELLEPMGYEFTDEEWDRFQDFLTAPSGQWRLSDYGMKPLQGLARELAAAKSAEEQLVIVDRMLNVTHQRGDMAENFVEGGKETLDWLANHEGTRFRKPIVTPEQDKAYMDAVKRGDMETAQKMVDAAAKAAGYNERAYHGSPQRPFWVFDPLRRGDRTGANSALLGFFASTDRGVASEYKLTANERYGAMKEGPLGYGLEDAERNVAIAEDIGTDAVYDEEEKGWLAQITDHNQFGDPITYDDGMVYDTKAEALDAAEEEKNKEIAKAQKRLEEAVEKNRVAAEAMDADRTLHNLYVRLSNPLIYDYDGGTFKDKSYSDLVQEAIDEGHDGVIMENTRDAVDSDTLSDVIVFFESSQAKLADPVTRDDAGRVIPLSERFNEGSDDIRFRRKMTEDDYRGSHRAPTGEFGEGSLDAMDRTYPKDIYDKDAGRIYGDGISPILDSKIAALIRRLRGKPDAEVTVFRAVPKGVQTEIEPGNWVTPIREYAEMHGGRFDEGMDIIERKVKAGELFTEGNSLYEYGWNPDSDTRFRKQTETPEFKRWFRDSKVVDADGKPLVVYHGVKDADMRVENGAVVFAPKFDVFDTKGRTEPGAWFSPDPKVAAKYGTPIPFYLKAVAPVREEGPLTAAPENADAVYRMRGKGDSIAQAWEIAVFRPDQIKLATGNRGTFDPDNPDIRFRVIPPANTTPSQDPPAEDELLKDSDYWNAIRGAYKPGESSRTKPIRELPELRVGMWRVSSLNGIRGRDIDQLRWLDPSTLSLAEDMVERNEEGRGWDADRYADWNRQGLEAPPIEVVETDNGVLRVIDGHRRVAAAKKTGKPVLAWVSPSMDVPEGVHYDGDPSKPIVKTSLTIEAWRNGTAMRTEPLTGGFSDYGIATDIRFRRPLTEVGREYLAAAQTAVDNAPTMAEKRRALDEWKAKNPEAVREIEGEQSPRVNPQQARAEGRYVSRPTDAEPDLSTADVAFYGGSRFADGFLYRGIEGEAALADIASKGQITSTSETAKRLGKNAHVGMTFLTDYPNIASSYVQRDGYVLEIRMPQDITAEGGGEIQTTRPIPADKISRIFAVGTDAEGPYSIDVTDRFTSPLALRPDGTLAGAAKPAPEVKPTAPETKPIEQARAAVDAVPPKADGSVDMEARQRVLDEWKSANPEAAQDADTGEAIQGRAGMRYRSFDSPDEATGIDRSSSTRPFLHGGAYEIEYSGTAKPIGPSQPEGGRGTIDPASVTRVFYEPEYWTPETRAQQLASDLPQLRSMFPNAEFVAVRLADDAETRVASPLALRPDGTLAGVQEQADIRFRPGPRSLPQKQAPTQEDIDKVRNMSLADSYVRAYPSEDPRARVAQAVVELAYGDGLTPKKLEVMLSEGKLAYNSDPQAAELALLAGTTPTGKAEDEARRMARDKFAVNAMTERAVNSGDVDQAATAMLATWRWYERGTETARALRLRFDPLQTPGDRRAWVMRAILTPTDTDIVRAKRALDMRAQVERMKPTAKRALAILKKLRSVSVQDKATGKTRTLDITKFTNEDLMNDDLMNRVMIEIATERASWGDKIHEYWRNSILSGIPTQIVNVLGNAGHAGLEAFIQRPIQAIVNSVVGADDAATARSVAAMWRGMGPSIRQANINFARAWATENSVTGTRTSKLEDANTAISGLKGRIIRVPQRAMTAADEWFKTVFMSMLTADYATREFDALLKQGKAVEADRDAYMASAQQMGTSAYGKAWDETLRWAFQHQPGVIASGVSRWRNDPALGFWMKFIFPFVKTPANIVTTGLRKSPAHLLPYLVRLAKGRYTTDEAIKYGAEQATAMIVMGVLYMLATGDDDDELNRPRITGSRASGGKQKPGERESELRDYPPQSIRFGDRWVSYSRFEPFATMIATMVDVMKMGKSATEGKWGDIPVQAFNSFKGNFRDKTFLSGLGDLIEITESGDEQKAMLTLQKIAAGFSPNLVRSTVRAFDPYIRDMRNRSKGAEWYKTTGKRLVQMALPAPGIAPIPRYDIAGNPVARDGGGIYNALSPFRVQSATRLTPVDAMLKSWNDKQDNDSDKWMPSVPDQPRITYGGVRKEVIKLTDEEYAEFQVLAGKRAERGLELWLSRKQRLGSFRMDDPQERDIEQVKEIYESARQYARDRIRNKVIRRYRLDRSSRP